MAWKLFPPMLLGLCLLLPLAPCHSSAPPCPPPPDGTNACEAIDHFWKVFQGNDYAHVDEVIGHLTAAQAAHPQDATINFLLGGSHLWKFHERGRANRSAASVAPHAHLALHHLKIVKELDPNRRTVDVFRDLAIANVALLQGDKALLEESFEAIRSDTRKDPAFNGFVQGWVFSALMSHQDCRYPEAIAGYMATFDTCAGFRVPRAIPRVGPILYSYLALRGRKDSVCSNSALVPHNLEATFLGLGDAHLKNGSIVKARMAYRSVKRAPSYAAWPYKEQLECRLANLAGVRDKFRADTGKLDVIEPAMFLQSSYACTACHATNHAAGGRGCSSPTRGRARSGCSAPCGSCK